MWVNGWTKDSSSFRRLFKHNGMIEWCKCWKNSKEHWMLKPWPMLLKIAGIQFIHKPKRYSSHYLVSADNRGVWAAVIVIVGWQNWGFRRIDIETAERSKTNDEIGRQLIVDGGYSIYVRGIVIFIDYSFEWVNLSTILLLKIYSSSSTNESTITSSTTSKILKINKKRHKKLSVLPSTNF